MTCPESHVHVHDYIDGEMTVSDRERFETHLAHCPECALAVDRYRSLGGFLSELERLPAPRMLGIRVMSKLKAAGRVAEQSPVARRLPTGIFRWLPASLRLPVAAAFALVLALAILPVTAGLLMSLAGQGTVLVAETYVEAHDQVDFIERVVDNAGHIFRMMLTVGQAILSVLATIGELFLIPALGMLLVLALGAVIYLRNQHRRSAQNAMFSL